jgi:ParB-like chromosome segregation protein Spo0J
MKNKQKLEYKRVDSLIPYINNSRKHSDDQVSQLAASIKEFGFRNPILVDGNGIIAGHGRLLAAKKLELEEVPTLDCSDMTEAQKKAYVIADNKLALNAEWDYDLLKIEIDDLLEKGFEIDILGFHASELNAGEIDYSVLDDAPDSINDQLDDLEAGIRKAIQIEFEPDHYQEAVELTGFWRKQGAYIGYMLLELLRKEKEKL